MQEAHSAGRGRGRKRYRPVTMFPPGLGDGFVVFHLQLCLNSICSLNRASMASLPDVVLQSRGLRWGVARHSPGLRFLWGSVQTGIWSLRSRPGVTPFPALWFLLGLPALTLKTVWLYGSNLTRSLLTTAPLWQTDGCPFSGRRLFSAVTGLRVEYILHLAPCIWECLPRQSWASRSRASPLGH